MTERSFLLKQREQHIQSFIHGDSMGGVSLFVVWQNQTDNTHTESPH